MVLIFVVLMVLLFVLIVRRRNNKISLNIGIFMAALLLNSFVLLTYLGKVSMLDYTFDFEFRFLKEFYRVNISYYDLRLFSNISVVFFVCANVLFYINVSEKNKYTAIYVALAIMAAAMFLYFNSDYYSEGLFIARSNGTLDYKKSYWIKRCVITLNYAVIFLPAAFVDLYLIQKSIRTRTVIIRKNTLMLVCIVSVFQFAFTYFYIFTPINKFLQLETNISYMSQNGSSVYYFAAAVLLLVTSVLFIFFSDILEPVDFRKKAIIKKRMEIQFCDIRHIFHTYKNVFLGIKTINNRSIECDSRDDIMKNIALINSQCDKMLRQISNFMEMYNTPKLNLCVADINDILKNSINNAKETVKIKIRTHFEKDLFVYADEAYLSEAFYNIIKNADESMDKPDGCLDITLWCERNYVCLSFKDNGPGVDRKQRKLVFNPFATTKGTHKNSGIGLTYVRNIVEAHLGFADISSKPGKYFDLQIILPVEKEERIK